MRANELDFPIEIMCEVFRVSRSGYYAWRGRDQGDQEAKRNALLRSIEDIYKGSRGTYGSPRIFKVLQGMGQRVSKAKVERMMKDESSDFAALAEEVMGKKRNYDINLS